jgi:hypothetical protein
MINYVSINPSRWYTKAQRADQQFFKLAIQISNDASKRLDRLKLETLSY